ncbi:MAG: DUF4389 domain-containing protein [Acidimicrobiia bacterium]|nr:DUF4389 domain-containing protein [Acidimicrobiia bacterium]MBT8192205.1 DUF4389 domain-containing protein [Acidimicrobiia bacterium]MBT8247442.1 DUF4389 domain-containing protein [Acidimicrobiia bacterium]NNF88384.1 DUF4389 domain-containing protein [Acidimicrobiia bacterium]NNJ47886.1 DUF4389 domain-containing protein [Acidimicrobiia bacterium]
MTTANVADYAARLSVDYPDRDLDRLSTFFRIFYLIPIVIVVSALGGMLTIPALLLIVFRQKYPRWWFDFNLEFTRFSTRISAYGALISDEYPSTTDEQYVHLELDYPDAKALNRWAPLYKWFLAIPHYLVLAVLGIAVLLALIVAWFIILFTGRYPEGIYDFVVGVMRWSLRVQAYAVLLITDEYPPFSLG